MFTTRLVDQKLPGYTDKMTVEVSVQSIQITDGNMQVQWSIDLAKSGPRLPGTETSPPLFKGNFDMTPPPTILNGLAGFFTASAPGLVANLEAKAIAVDKALKEAASAEKIAAQKAIITPPTNVAVEPMPSGVPLVFQGGSNG